MKRRLSSGMDWFTIWEKRSPTKNSHCKESIKSFCYHNWSTLLTRHPFSCEPLLCEVVTDEKSGRESVMRVCCKGDNDCTRWALVFFVPVEMFLTPTILVFTQLEWNESVNADMSKDFGAGMRKWKQKLHRCTWWVNYILFTFSFFFWWAGGWLLEG